MRTKNLTFKINFNKIVSKNLLKQKKIITYYDMRKYQQTTKTIF